MLKYYDEKGYVVGLSCGEITDNSSEIRSIDELHSLSYLLENKPRKKGFLTHIVDIGEDSYGFEYNYEEIPQSQLPEEVLKELLKDEILNSISVDSRPAEKEGFKLVPKFNGTSIYWEFEKEEEPTPEEDVTQGTYLNPIQYVNGMEIKITKWYTDGDNIWEAIQSGIPTGFDDTEYFDIIA